MATVTYLNESYECTYAIKGENYICLIDANGRVIASFHGIANFSGFTISGGSWITPPSDDDCNVAIVRWDGSIGVGSHKCSDIGSIGADPVFNTVTANKIIGAVYA